MNCLGKTNQYDTFVAIMRTQTKQNKTLTSNASSNRSVSCSVHSRAWLAADLFLRAPVFFEYWSSFRPKSVPMLNSGFLSIGFLSKSIMCLAAEGWLTWKRNSNTKQWQKIHLVLVHLFRKRLYLLQVSFIHNAKYLLTYFTVSLKFLLIYIITWYHLSNKLQSWWMPD